MIEKKPDDDGRHVHVRFSVPAAYGPVAVVGDFNEWDRQALPLELDGDGDVRVAVAVMTVGRRYRFRYVNPQGVYCNDEAADDYELNGYGGYNCVLDLTDPPPDDATDEDGRWPGAAGA